MGKKLYFKDPFFPRRYLTDYDGNKLSPDSITQEIKFKPDPNVVTFGVGKRKCLGESLGRIEVFMFFTGMLRRFKISLVNHA